MFKLSIYEQFRSCGAGVPSGDGMLYIHICMYVNTANLNNFMKKNNVVMLNFLIGFC